MVFGQGGGGSGGKVFVNVIKGLIYACRCNWRAVSIHQATQNQSRHQVNVGTQKHFMLDICVSSTHVATIWVRQGESL